jgi:hypothetical protein
MKHGDVWPIRLNKKEQHPSQYRWPTYWFRRMFLRWIYPHRVPIRILPGVDEHYGQMLGWIKMMEPDHEKRVWMVINRMGFDDQMRPLFMQGEIRFRSQELHTAFLLRFPLDTIQGYAII